MATLRLESGQLIPQLGLGTWKSSPGKVYEAVKLAIDIGYRHFDCAFVYGNENEVGQALKDSIDSGKVKREELFITSKLWNTYHQKDRVELCLKQTLKALQLDYLDLYLIHWPLGYQEGDVVFPRDSNGNVLVSDIDYLETWQGMESVKKQNLVKAIGVSNFNSKQLKRLMEHCEMKPVALQIECHPYLNQKRLIEFCKDRNIVVIAYSPLGSPDRPFAKPGEPLLLDDPKLLEIAERYRKSIAQILIRYQIQRGLAVLPKSITPDRIKQNFDVFDFRLSSEDIAIIDSFDRNYRFLSLAQNGPLITGHRYYPFNEDF
ncbi:lysine-specific histone demethylase [Sarcoptes scabiei]|nr:lysine-specific histone demethylase [Sarcoptes scabiei]